MSSISTLKEYFFRFTDYFEENKTARAIRTGIIVMIPVIILRSFTEMFLNFPIPAYQQLLNTTALGDILRLLEFAARSYFSLLLAAALGWSFAREWRVPFYQAVLMAILAIGCFLIIIHTEKQQHLSDYLSIFGVFSSLIASIFASRLYLYFLRRFSIPSMQTNYDLSPYLQGIIYSVPPILLVFAIFALLQALLLQLTGGQCLQEQITVWMVSWFLSLAAIPLLADAVFIFLTQLFWFFGINGHNVLYSINDAYYSSLTQQNMQMILNGGMPTWIINNLFNNTYLLLGGCGSILALILAIFCCSRNHSMRTIAAIGVLPAAFNISEIICFGIPIVCNPIFFLPFLFIPLVNLAIAYAATACQLVPIAVTNVHWTTPIFLSGYLTTGSVSGLVLQALLLLLDFLLYMPFVKIYDGARKYQFNKLVRNLEHYYQEKEVLLEHLRIAEFNDEQHAVCTVLIHDLEQAIQSGQLFMLYQPQFDRSGRCIGAEALLRWNHPIAGFIYPPLIIALAKISGQLSALEKLIFHNACGCIAAIEKGVGQNHKISVNITGDSLNDIALEESIASAIHETHISAAHLWIEITEQDALASTSEATEKLTRLKANGHKLLIDDFGMGHTSVSYLRTNLFNVVKLDGAITRSVLENQNSQEIISSLISLSKSLNLQVIAEYVETVSQRDKLASLGCDAFQGYLYSKPISQEELLELLRRQQSSQP